ncbi:MAG: cation:H+ antiporter [Paraglaciecola sp.]|jgi:cation:H+ antiporter
MILATVAIVLGFTLLLYSAERFVEGAAIAARYAGMPSLLIGMIIVGFGTSAPEMMVSVFAAYDDNPGLALGNAYGSNIVNIALVLGVTAMICPILVHSNIVQKELPLLLALVVFAGFLLLDGVLSRVDGVLLLCAFFLLVGWSIFAALKNKGDHLGNEVDDELINHDMSLRRAVFWLITGLTLLLISSKILVWGAVSIALELGISDVIIGLTIVALGTSLPELAASVMAVRKGEHDIALGNVIGSNMFNLLAVAGLAGVIAPANIDPALLSRDWTVMALLTLVLLVMAYGFKKQGRVNRFEGSLLVLSYVAYNVYLAYTVLSTA